MKSYHFQPFPVVHMVQILTITRYLPYKIRRPRALKPISIDRFIVSLALTVFEI